MNDEYEPEATPEVQETLSTFRRALLLLFVAASVFVCIAAATR